MGHHSTTLPLPNGELSLASSTGNTTGTVRTLNFRLIEPRYYSHLWAKYLVVAALRECNGDIEQKCNWGHGETSGH